MRVLDLAWAAGIVDGEGCITLYRSQTRTGTAYVMKLTVVNTYLPMLERLHSMFGCGYLAERGKLKAHHKRRWIWEVTTKNAQAVLEELRPYLFAKREECHLALLSRSLINPHGNNRRNEHREVLDRLLVLMKELKH